MLPEEKSASSLKNEIKLLYQVHRVSNMCIITLIMFKSAILYSSLLQFYIQC